MPGESLLKDTLLHTYHNRYIHRDLFYKYHLLKLLQQDIHQYMFRKQYNRH